MSLLVQKASGTNAVHFASPTTAGNTIVLVISWQGPANELLDQVGNEGKISAGGNVFARNGSQFVYNQVQPVTDSLSDTQNAIMNCPNAIAVSDITTVATTPAWTTAHDRIMWAYEIQDMPLVTSTAALGSLDSSAFTQTPTTSLDINFFGTWFDEDDGVCKFDVAAVTSNQGVVAAVAAGWTLDTLIENRFAVAYTESKNVNADVPVFTSSVASNYAANAEASFSLDADCPAAPPLGSVIVTKSTNPAASPQVFAYTDDYGSPFTLTDGGSNDSGQMTPGTFSVVETPVAGWTTSVSIVYRYGQGGFGGTQLYGGGTVSAASVISPPVIVGATDAITVAYVNTQLCVIHVSATSLSFTATEGGSNPAAQTVSVTNTGGGGSVGFTVTASQPWITVTSSGTTDQDISVGINITGLVANTYNGNITISSACPGAPIVVALALVIELLTPCPQPDACPFTLGDAQSALSQRLYDETSQFWPADELTVYIVEALRTWNALTSYWRDDFIFDSQPGTVWYDITNTTVAPNTLRPLTVTDQYLMEAIEYHLLEPLTSSYPLTWTGSVQFDVEDLQRALQRRRDEIVSTTGCTITRLVLPANPGRIALPNRATEIRRVAFLPEDETTGRPTPLFQDDVWSLQAFRPDYTVEPGAIPNIYVISTEPIRSSGTGPVMTFSASPDPGVVGQYEILALESGLVFCPTAATNVTIPDDWTWVLKFGALSDLLGRESNSKDTLRARYAEMRYRQGLALMSNAPAMLVAMRSGNVPLQIDAVKAVDEYDPTWEAATGPPTMILTAGLNMIAISSSPGTPTVGYSEGGYSLGGYGGSGPEDPVSLTATVVRNAPVPIAAGDCIQVTRDDFDVIIDYAQHLSAFKMGGAEFVATMPLYERFMQAAALNYSRLGEQGEFQKLLWQRSQVEAALNPRYSDVSPESDNG